MKHLEDKMKFRKKMRKRKDKKVFSKTASKVNKKNYSATPMRGGIRL